MGMTPELIEFLRDFEALSPMKCKVVSSEEEFEAAVKENSEAGRRLAAVSNAGLSGPYRRLTFLPHSAFTDAATPVAPL